MRRLGLIGLFFVASCQGLDRDAASVEPDASGLWAESGAIAFPLAAERMRRNNPHSSELSQRHRESLRFAFGSLVDRVLIHWQAQPLNEWATDQFGIAPIGEDSDGQAYGLDIYIRFQEGERPVEDELALLLHELAHCDQFERSGSSLADFGYLYFRAYKKAGEQYWNNPLEGEARQAAQDYVVESLQRWNQLGS